MSVTLLVRLYGRKGHGERLSELLKPVPKDNDIAGCFGIEVFRNGADEDEFLLLEHWQSVADHQAHIEKMEQAGGFKEMQENVESVTRTYHQEIRQDS